MDHGGADEFKRDLFLVDVYMNVPGGEVGEVEAELILGTSPCV